MIWNAVVPGVLLLGIVIFVHELGHFLAAKWRKVRVLRFSLGFGPALFSWVRNGTEYRFSWIPLGGYVQMAGDSIEDANAELPQAQDEFLSHPWYGRFAIALAGPMANLVTAFFVMCVVGLVGLRYPDYPNRVGATPDTSFAYGAGIREGDRVVAINGTPVGSWVPIFISHSAIPAGKPVTVEILRGERRLDLPIPAEDREPFFSSLRRPLMPPIVGSVVTGMPAYKAGLREGDRVLAVNGKPITTWDELPLALRGTVDQKVRIRVAREGRTIDIDVVPMDPEGRGRENARIGIEPPRGSVYVQRFGPLESIQMGARGTWALVGSVYSGMWLTISRPLYYREYLGGPLFIAQAASEQARRGVDSYLQFLAMINIAIMAFNLLPLPLLDGGHMVLAVLEGVRRQSLSAAAYIRFQKVGLVIMGTLLVLILANDPLRMLQRHRAIGQAKSAPQEQPVAPSSP